MDNFEKVAGDWVFFRAVEMFSAILLALLAGFLKGVLEKVSGGGSSISETQSPHVYGI